MPLSDNPYVVLQEEMVRYYKNFFGLQGPIGPNGASFFTLQNAIPITSADIGLNGYIISNPGVYVLVEDCIFNTPGGFGVVGITFVGGNGNGATGYALSSNGSIQGVIITNPGTGYTSAPDIQLYGYGENAVLTANISNGSVISVTVTNGGIEYVDTMQAAITIMSSNVTLLLGKQRLSQNQNAQLPFVCGIFIPDPLPNSTDVNAIGYSGINIFGDNAIIDGFSMMGICVKAHIADINMVGFTVKNCGILASISNRPFEQYTPTGLPGNNSNMTFPIGGIFIGESDIYGLGPIFFTQKNNSVQNRIKSVRIHNITCLNNYFEGIHISNATDVYMTECNILNTFFDDFNSNMPTTGAFLGSITDYENQSLINMIVKNCSFSGTVTIGSSLSNVMAYGCILGLSENIRFENCYFNNIQTTFSSNLTLANSWTNIPSSVITAGILSISISDLSFLDCIFNNINSNGWSVGVHINGRTYTNNVISPRNIKFTNCIASNINQTNNQSIAAGFEIFHSKNVILENCRASDIICNGISFIPGSVNSIGFHISGGSHIATSASSVEYSSENIIFRNCISQNILAINGGNVYGFWITNAFDVGVNNVVHNVIHEDCIVEGCNALLPGNFNSIPSVLRGVSVGFGISKCFGSSITHPVVYTNCKASHNKGSPFLACSSDVVYPFMVGDFFYSAGFYCSGQAGFVTEKHLYQNCSSIDNVYGFLFQNDKLCIMRNCESYLNIDEVTGIGEGITDLGLNTITFTGTIDTSLITPTLNTFAINNSASDIDNFYNGQLIIFNSGLNQTAIGYIVSYIGASKQITICQPGLLLSFSSLVNIPVNGDIISIVHYGMGNPFTGTVNTNSISPNTTIFALNSSACSIDNAYSSYSNSGSYPALPYPQYLLFTSGINAGQYNLIIDYIGATRQITVAVPFANVPGNDDQLIITTVYNGICSFGISDSEFVLDIFSIELDHIYEGQYIMFITGLNSGLMRQISTYDGTTRQVTVSVPFNEMTSVNDQYQIFPVTSGITISPLQSFSLFESNNTVTNGYGSVNNGFNGNNNILYGTSLDPVPTLASSITNTGIIDGNYYFPQVSTYSLMHNLSTIR